jgi:single-strand DNA-binding protein
MNRATLVGRLTKEPELRATTSGVSVCSFTIAVDRRFKQDGHPSADFIPIVVWRGQAENCGKYLTKGSQIAVCGSIQTRSYDDKNGNKVYITEIVADEVQFLSKSNNEAENPLKTAEEMFSPAEDEDVPF